MDELQLKRVLCATALDESGDLALREADRWARRHGAQLTVLHALPTSPGVPMFPEHVERQMVERERLGRQVIEAVLERVAEVTKRAADEASVAVEAGPAHAAIMRAAEESHADLIVVGASGHRHILLGGITERVVRYAHASVLVVRDGPTTGQVLVGTDFSSMAGHAVRVASDEARRRGGGLTVAHCLETAGMAIGLGAAAGAPPGSLIEPTGAFPVAQVRSAAEARLKDEASRTSPPAGVCLEDEDPSHALPRLAASLHAELVVVGTAGHTGLARVLLGSVAEAVVRSAPCSVLVVRRQG